AVAIGGLYNGMVGNRNKCDNAWQTIDAQLQRRNDLIPNLVETVKGYAAHEKGTLEAVTNARAACTAATTPQDKMAADNVLTGALRQLFAVAEAYPDLKANTNFQQLQTDLTDTENKIVYARQSFNDVVLMYNNSIQTFPGNIIAGMFHFEPRQGFQVEDEVARKAPKVDFGAAAPAPQQPSAPAPTAPADDTKPQA
ncbi:MAG: LemA family protein, partial [Atopobiaceae bacterium]|nr:LemA family protein [Atopobiaceae bacterium]